MREFIEERQLALECLKLACADTVEKGWISTLMRAEKYLAFVTGKDADDAKAKLDVIRKVFS